MGARAGEPRTRPRRLLPRRHPEKGLAVTAALRAERKPATLSFRTRENSMQRTYKIAHIKYGGRDLIVVPFDSPEFPALPDGERETIKRGLETCATLAGLIGELCVVWRDADSMRVMASSATTEFLQSKGWEFVRRNLNFRLRCSHVDSLSVSVTSGERLPYSDESSHPSIADQAGEKDA